MARPSAKEAILDAAERLVTKSADGNLTLEAVAAEANVSKGGLLYHFASKEALLEAMLKRQLDRFEADVEEARGKLTKDPEAELRGFVHAGTADSEPNKQLCAALLAAVANKPELLEPARQFHQRNLQMAKRAGIGFERAAVLWLATDGLWFLEMLQLSPLSKEERKRVADTLFELARKWK